MMEDLGHNNRKRLIIEEEGHGTHSGRPASGWRYSQKKQRLSANDSGSTAEEPSRAKRRISPSVRPFVSSMDPTEFLMIFFGFRLSRKQVPLPMK